MSSSREQLLFSAAWHQLCQLQQVTYSSLSCKPSVKWFHEKTLLASSLTLFKRGNSIESCGQDISRNKYASWKISEIRAFPVLSSKNTDKYIKTGLFLSTQIKLKQDITFIYNFIIPCYSVQTLAIKCPSLDLTTSYCGLPSASKFKHFKNCCLTSNAFFMDRSDSLV